MDIEIIAKVNKVSERIQRIRQERRMSRMSLWKKQAFRKAFLTGNR